MKRVREFNKNLYIGREWECERLIRRLEKSGRMERLKCQQYGWRYSHVWCIR